MAETRFPHSEVKRMKSSETNVEACKLSKTSGVRLTPIISPNRDSTPTISRSEFLTLIPRGNTRGSKNPEQADNAPVSKKQAHNHTQTERGSGRQIRMTLAEASSARVTYPRTHGKTRICRPSLTWKAS